MSGAYLENLNHVYPGLQTIFGGQTDLRGTVAHIVSKARELKQERGIHRLKDDELIVMTAYWEGLGLAKKQRESLSGGVADISWYHERASSYMHELFVRGVHNESHPAHVVFSNTVVCLYLQSNENH